jgi:SsrA-binding protein
MDKKSRFAKTIDVKNKKAGFEYFFIQTHIAGLQLQGTEIKSIREGRFHLSDSYCYFDSEELYIKNLNISKYEQGTYLNHDPLRDRKLLLKRRELNRLEESLKDQGLTIVPTRLFISENGLAKLEIALAKGKKLYDKRETIKERDLSRER